MKPGHYTWTVPVEVLDSAGLWVDLRIGDQEATLKVEGFGTWERLPDPGPEWLPGEPVVDELGMAFFRTADGNWRSAYGNVHADSTMKRPLRRLVVEEAPRG